MRQLAKTCQLDDAAERDLLRWLLEEEPSAIGEKIATRLELRPKHAEDLIAQLTKLRMCIDPSIAPFDVFRSFCGTNPNPQTFARRQIADAKKALGDGHFFLSEIVGEPEVGFVVRMRRIYTVDATDCFASETERRVVSHSHGTTAARFARLAPLYRFKITQLFAHQFSRIGLPIEITALGDLAVEDMVSQLVKDIK